MTGSNCGKKIKLGFIVLIPESANITLVWSDFSAHLSLLGTDW